HTKIAEVRSAIFMLLIIGWITLGSKGTSYISHSYKGIPADPLPSWNEGPNKKAIIDFVAAVTAEGSSSFVKPEDRIATFDNDGTLWAERPYVQELFAFYQVKKMVEKTP